MKSKKTVQDKLYLPLKLNGDKLEYMLDSRGKVKHYRSEETLLEYTPDCDKIAVYKLINIKDICLSTVSKQENARKIF